MKLITRLPFERLHSGALVASRTAILFHFYAFYFSKCVNMSFWGVGERGTRSSSKAVSNRYPIWLTAAVELKY